VQAMGLEKAMAERFGVENRRSADQSVRGKRLAARLERSVDLLIALATAIVLWRGSLLVVNRVLTPGDLLVFLAYLKNAFKPMRDMAKYSGRLASAFASAERIVELLEVPVQSADDQAAPVAPVQVSRIHFRSVSFAYPNRSIAIHDLHLQARVGEVLALVGPSGAGKSTLMNLLLRLYEPTAGQILFDDVNICHCGLSSLRRCIAIVPQESMLFNMSIRDNISIGAGPVSDARIQAAATLAGAHDFITRLPDGYDTVISERGGTLSGGQQRRLAIARAAVREAPVLILDEPMAGLDLHNRALVTQALDKLKANRIVLMIVHDAPSALAADQVVMLRDGRVVEMGKPSDLSSLEGPFSRHMLDAMPVSAAAS
jgi:ATP-binding cassette subfamily B protein